MKFYITTSPDEAKHIIRNTEQQAIDDAKIKVAEDGRPRYVCKILHKVEPASMPVKVTKVE